jgi:drug/metabolite transporter (DMT)-like permease
VLGIAGAVLIQQPQRIAEMVAGDLPGLLNLPQRMSEGNLAALLAVVSSFTSAIAMLGLNRLRQLDHRAIVVHFSTVATVVSVVSIFVCEHKHAYEELLNPPTILALLGTGVFATVGQLFLTRAYADGAPSKVAVVGLSQIVFSLALDVTLFNHGLDAVTLLGMALVVGPTTWVMLRPGAQLEAA